MQLTAARWVGGPVDIEFETFGIGNIVGTGLRRAFAFHDGEKGLPAPPGNSPGIKPAEGLHAALRTRGRARYSDILISGVFLLATSSRFLSGIHTHFMEFIIRSQLLRLLSRRVRTNARRNHPGTVSSAGRFGRIRNTGANAARLFLDVDSAQGRLPRGTAGTTVRGEGGVGKAVASEIP